MRARELLKALSHPSDQVLCKLLDNNCIINCDLNSRDVKNASIYLGPCEDCRAGKATQPKFIEINEPGKYPGDTFRHNVY